ncbi:MAG TPA: type II toxin-antitoxin system VapC family toxin [Caulobacteraceae bacterium]|nr:type II toxin-antitoxin system VapC family toxin [Caulobacteraceae bacterium]
MGPTLTHILIDASAAVAWLLPGQRTETSETLLSEASSHTFTAPHIFPAEIRNALLALEWRGRLTSSETDRAMTALSAYGIAIEPPPDHADYDGILALARGERLTVYDTVYLWDAMRGGYTLASSDGDLLAAASRNGVEIRDVRR